MYDLFLKIIDHIGEFQSKYNEVEVIEEKKEEEEVKDRKENGQTGNIKLDQ